jgi:hypothetical protein
MNDIDKWKYNLYQEERAYKDPLARDKAERALVADLKEIVSTEYATLLEDGKSANLDTYIPKVKWQEMYLAKRVEIADETVKNYIESRKKAFNIEFPKEYVESARKLRTAALKKALK